MDLKDVKKIVELMKENELWEFEMEDEGGRIALKRCGPPAAIPAGLVMAPSVQGANISAVAPKGGESAVVDDSEKNYKEIRSPMVGTFYRSPAPDAEPFVKIGQEITAETVVCIIEAMKVMNEIKAEVSGIVRKIVLENATPVEFGQVLFKIEPK